MNSEGCAPKYAFVEWYPRGLAVQKLHVCTLRLYVCPFFQYTPEFLPDREFLIRNLQIFDSAGIEGSSSSSSTCPIPTNLCTHMRDSQLLPQPKRSFYSNLINKIWFFIMRTRKTGSRLSSGRPTSQSSSSSLPIFNSLFVSFAGS